MTQDLIRHCHLLSLPGVESELDAVIRRVVGEAKGMQVDCCLQALEILGGSHFLSVFVSRHPKRIAMLQTSLREIRRDGE